MLVGKIQPGQITSPARKLFLPANFHNAYIQNIDTTSQVIKTTRALDGKEYDIQYDHLVVALGSVDNLSRYPGISEHAIKLKEYWDCFRLRSRILSMMEMAEFEPDPAERRRLPTFVVAGGNYAGIEVASELIDYLGKLTRREYPRINATEIKVIIVHSGERVLPELGQQFPRLIEYTERHLARQGLEILTRRRMASATPAEVILNDGTVIPTRTLISCTGTAQSPLLDRIDAERDDRGRLKTDANMHLLGHTNIWAAGDCAAVPHPKGRHLSATGDLCDDRGYAHWQESATRHYRKEVEAVRVSRARRRLRLRRTSRCGARQERAADRLHRVAFVAGDDACVPPKLGTASAHHLRLARRTVDRTRHRQPEHRASHGISFARYELGQVIIQQGDTGGELYMIQEGEVVVEQESNEGVKVLGKLGAGDHFGEQAVFDYVRRTATIRAKTAVRLMVVRREQALELTRSLKDFAEQATRLPEVKEL